MDPRRTSGLSALFLLLACLVAANAQTRRIVWADEFSGPAETAPDATKWDYDLGAGFDGGWGNNEKQYYTSRTDNAYLDGEGHLVIKASRENFTGNDGITRQYTSARLVTRGKFEVVYGRVEARLKVAFGQGIWPAFWMLGNDLSTVGWPQCGEIDIMENIGREPAIVHGTLHGPGYSGATPLTGFVTLPEGKRFTDDFHIFAVEWEPRAIRFYLDNQLYQTYTSDNLPAGAKWVFDHPFYLILNVAVGGNWPGEPDGTTIFPQTMLVDYVRVYERARSRMPTTRRTINRRPGR